MKYSNILWLASVIFLMVMAGSTSAQSSLTGKWRGVFGLRSGTQVPFNFELKQTGNHTNAYLLNAEERFEAGIITIKGDSLFIPLNQFDNELAFKIEGNTLKGYWRKQNGMGTPVPVTAEKDKLYRFDETGIAPSGSINGTYDMLFHGSDGKTDKAVGVFTQKGNKLRATFLRVTGDSRYLEGIVTGDTFYLSSFIGSSPSYYKGSFTKDGHLKGEVTGLTTSQPFEGTHNEAAALPDAYTLTTIKEGSPKFDFTFPDMNGMPVSLHDKKYQGKVVIVTIGGTWCPNCMDETSFLSPWFTANRSKGVEIISIQYERQTDSAFTRKVLARLKQRFNIQYDLVVGGIADKQAVSASLPSLNNFISFPTTLFINRKGEVVKIHTGYSGPATGKYYQEFLKEFNEVIKSML